MTDSSKREKLPLTVREQFEAALAREAAIADFEHELFMEKVRQREFNRKADLEWYGYLIAAVVAITVVISLAIICNLQDEQTGTPQNIISDSGRQVPTATKGSHAEAGHSFSRCEQCTDI